MCQILLLMKPYSYAMHASVVLIYRVKLPYYVLWEVLILLPFVKKIADSSCAPLFSNMYLELGLCSLNEMLIWNLNFIMHFYKCFLLKALSFFDRAAAEQTCKILCVLG